MQAQNQSLAQQNAALSKRNGDAASLAMQKAQKELTDLEVIAESERQDFLADRLLSAERIQELEDSNLELAALNEDLGAERRDLIETITDLETSLKEASRIPKSVGRINADQLLEAV
jgi:hypothetical protein